VNGSTSPCALTAPLRTVSKRNDISGAEGSERIGLQERKPSGSERMHGCRAQQSREGTREAQMQFAGATEGI